MKQRIEKLSKIANSLDDNKLSKLAADVDNISKRYVNIKTAQYVGVQGYWIRNTRCWSNCYRQKRATSPKLSAQQIWSECQNEYVESFNKNDTKWAKYAEEENLVKKFASAGLNKIASEVIHAESEYFNKSVEKKVAKGVEYPVAVFDTINERKDAAIALLRKVLPDYRSSEDLDRQAPVIIISEEHAKKIEAAAKL